MFDAVSHHFRRNPEIKNQYFLSMLPGAMNSPSQNIWSTGLNPLKKRMNNVGFVAGDNEEEARCTMFNVFWYLDNLPWTFWICETGNASLSHRLF